MSKQIKCQLVLTNNDKGDTSWKSKFKKKCEYAHVILVIDNLRFEGGFGIAMSPIKERYKGKNNHTVLNFTLPKKEAKKVLKRFMRLDDRGTYTTRMYLEFLMSGSCKPSKNKKAFACSCLCAYLLGVKKYWKYNSDELAQYVKDNLM